MATTTNGHYYPSETEFGDEEADILDQMKLMQESNDEIVADKVDKVENKGLSENDFTTTLKNKLDGISAGAQVNVIETVKVNGTPLTPSSKDVDITVPTKVSDLNNDSGFIDKDVNNLTNYELKTNTGTSIALSINSSTYVMTLQLKNSSGTVLSTGTIDLPIESMVVSATYDNTNKKIILTLQSGQTLDVPVGDLVSGLQTEITSESKLASDLVDDTNQTNKFVTASEKEQISTNATAITNIKDGTSIDSFGDVETALGEIDEEQTAQDELIAELQEDLAEAEACLKTTTGTGESVQLENTGEKKFKAFGISGNSKQQTYTGKNKWNNLDVETATNNDKTFTSNGNGTFTLSGTATGTAFFNLNKPKLPAGTYKLSNGVSGTWTGNVTIVINDTNYICYANQELEITLTEEATASSAYIRCYSGDNTTLTVKPMIRPASITDDTYEPYVGGTASPNPNYPQSINSSGDSGSINTKITNGKASTDTDYAEQTFTLPCQQPMRSIGTTRDCFFKNVVGSEYYNAELVEGAWYERHIIGQTELTENNVSTLVTSQSTSGYGNRIYINKTSLGWKNSWESGKALINNYSEAKITSEITSGKFSLNNGSSTLEIYDERFTDLATARQLLIGTIIVIEQATPTYLQCTAAQVTVLEAMAKAKSYYEQTNIYSSDTVSPIYNVEAYQDMNLVIDEINQAIVALGGV